MNDLIDTTEMYLRTIYELEEEGVVPLRARIAERLHQSGPTVSQTVARMERDGLVVVADDRHLKLTDHGRELAVAVMRKHRLAERLLVDVIGLEWEHVHNEACRWEHVMSEAVERKLIKLLNNPTTSPYGNPIPGLDKLDAASEPAPPAEADLVRLDEVAKAGGGKVEIRRIAEHVQLDERLMGQLRSVGIVPGRTVTIGKAANGDSTVEVSDDSGTTTTASIPTSALHAVLAQAR
ncbi:metal-dependent transcriptional regulator [Saccharomonospora xinjiangensis]|uniref:metal-dependent transcriptional regulator n=1 Tax=Saccharomonospora xinjiangensis TaxID=75294 RepID=UPI001070301A|nr:metal-dependent transcriptional regulator [Saccharomonospora xinjiangensis]QBQ61362.1 Iron-dependent repressor IdeR [Saccharomonospora xinjiangensis]